MLSLLSQEELTCVNSVGFLTMIVPLYQAELCHPSIRGRVTSLQQFMLGVGALSAAWISYGTHRAAHLFGPLHIFSRFTDWRI